MYDDDDDDEEEEEEEETTIRELEGAQRRGQRTRAEPGACRL